MRNHTNHPIEGNDDEFAWLFGITFDSREEAELDAINEFELKPGEYEIFEVNPNISQMCARTETSINKAMRALEDKVWYTRHLYHLAECKENGVQVPEDVLQAGKRVRSRYPKGELGPFDDFEWGMLNGKLSALRWVTGEEWDFLDT